MSRPACLDPCYPIDSQAALDSFVAFSRQLMDFQDIGWWCIHYDLDPDYFYCNDAMNAMFGLDQSRHRHPIAESCPIAGDYNSRVAAVDSTAAEIIFKDYAALLDGSASAYDNVFPYHLDGKVRHFRSQAKILQRDAAGRPTLIHGLIIEVTQQRDLEQALRQSKHHFKHLSQHDPLTGLYNRRSILKHCERLLQRAQDTQQPFSLWYLDLDHFKRINDEAGHDIGDRVLRDFAHQLHHFFNRNNEASGRLGGEEFLACTLGTDRATTRDMIQRFQTLLHEHAIPTGRKDGSPLTVSGGVVTWTPGQPPVSLDKLIALADKLLYSAKEQGRDHIEAAAAKA